MAESAEMEGSQFSVSQQEQTAKGALLENATDVKVRHSLKIRIILLVFSNPFFYYHNFGLKKLLQKSGKASVGVY